jgi:hypothetical protein
MVFKNNIDDDHSNINSDPISLMPLAGALLCDQTTCSISHFLNVVRAKLALRNSKRIRPSFVIIDFSAALLNAVLNAFNTENIHSHLRRCYKLLAGGMDAEQLKNITFIRLCCAHTMKAFSRSLNKLKINSQYRYDCLSLFAMLLNMSNFDEIFKFYSQIINIYANPSLTNAKDIVDELLASNCLDGFEFEEICNSTINEEVEKDDEKIIEDIDDLIVTDAAIIHQSPFNVKARERLELLDRIINKVPLDVDPTNPLYSKDVVLLFYKWYAYLPLWTGLLTDYKER